MSNKYRSDEQKRAILAEVSGHTGGASMDPILKRHGVAPSSYHEWRHKFGEGPTAKKAEAKGSAVSEAKRRSKYSEPFRKSVVHAYRTRAPGDTALRVAVRFRVSEATLKIWHREMGELSEPAQQAELPLENPTNGAPPLETLSPLSAARSGTLIAKLKEENHRLQQDNAILRGIATLAIERGLLQLTMGRAPQ